MIVDLAGTVFATLPADHPQRMNAESLLYDHLRRRELQVHLDNAVKLAQQQHRRSVITAGRPAASQKEIELAIRDLTVFVAFHRLYDSLYDWPHDPWLTNQKGFPVRAADLPPGYPSDNGPPNRHAQDT